MTVSRETVQVTTSIDHTFISYARHDSAFVTEVAAGLRARGVPIWIDLWNIEPGANWSASIDAALNACGKMLIVLSPEAVASDEVLTELRAAHNARKRILPLLHRPCDIPTRLLLTQYLDWSRSAGVSDASLDELADLLQNLRTPPPPAFRAIPALCHRATHIAAGRRPLSFHPCIAARSSGRQRPACQAC